MSAVDFAGRYGPVALITGASSGIGYAFAENLAARGLDLVLVARRRDRLVAIAAELSRDYGVRATPIAADLSHPEAPAVVADAAFAFDVGLLVSNAGFSMKGDHAGNDPEAMTRMLMVNAHAPMQLTRAFMPQLRSRGRGGIVLTSSVEGLIGCPYSAAYSATKALVRTLGEALWAELRDFGVDVLALCPGATDTEGAAKSGYDMSKVPGALQPAEVASQALDHLADGPVLVTGERYRATFETLTAMPRREALIAMAKGMKP
jgi:hypothetical protein